MRPGYEHLKPSAEDYVQLNLRVKPELRDVLRLLAQVDVDEGAGGVSGLVHEALGLLLEDRLADPEVMARFEAASQEAFNDRAQAQAWAEQMRASRNGTI